MPGTWYYLQTKFRPDHRLWAPINSLVKYLLTGHLQCPRHCWFCGRRLRKKYCLPSPAGKRRVVVNGCVLTLAENSTTSLLEERIRAASAQIKAYTLSVIPQQGQHPYGCLNYRFPALEGKQGDLVNWNPWDSCPDSCLWLWAGLLVSLDSSPDSQMQWRLQTCVIVSRAWLLYSHSLWKPSPVPLLATE